jgi:hypothetical protein
MTSTLTLRRTILTAVLSVVLLIPACGGDETNPPGPWFKVKTLVDREIYTVLGWEWETIQEPAVIQGWWKQDNINAGGTEYGLGPLGTGLNGVATRDNARVPAFWQFKSWDGPCNGKLFLFDLPNNTQTDTPNVNSGDMVTLWCRRVMFGDDSAVLGTDTIDQNNNVVSAGCCNTDTLYATNNTNLHPGDYVYSADGRFLLTLTYRGAAAIYKIDDGSLLWMTQEAGVNGAQLAFQTDGNLVLYDGGGSAVWATPTAGNPNSYLIMQDDGNLVIYDVMGNPLWASGTCCW